MEINIIYSILKLIYYYNFSIYIFVGNLKQTVKNYYLLYFINSYPIYIFHLYILHI